MFLAINYDKERHRKDGKQGGLLGRPWFLTLLWIAWALFVSWLNCWLTSGVKATQDWFHSPESYQFMDGTVNSQIFTTLHNGWAFSNFGNYQIMHLYPKIYWIIELIAAGVMLPLVLKTWLKWRPNHRNQYGNDRLTTEDEVLVQYPQIPDRGFEYEGIGGVPVSHIKATAPVFFKHHPIDWMHYYLVPEVTQLATKLPGMKNLPFSEAAKGFYSIDQTTVNSMIVGITRSGKGETLVMPFVDILSRGSEKCSMVVNDPKGELYQMSYETLRKRGYNVQVLNLQNTDFSMSYNPLQKIISFAQEGYYDETQQAVNTLSSSIYVDPNAKDKFWQNSSINLLNALILAVVDYAKRNDRWDEVTMDNVLHMMTELGSKQVNVNADGDIIPSADEMKDENVKMPSDMTPAGQKNKLLVYFAQLQKLNDKHYSQFRQMALDSFAQSKFAGDETSGNIYSSAMEGIKIYQQSNIAKLTSKNSVNFESIGFPRTMKFKVPERFKFKTAVIEIDDASGKKIEKRTQIVDKVGFINYAIKAKLPDQFTISISFDYRKNEPKYRDANLIVTGQKLYQRNGFTSHSFKRDPYTNQPLLKDVKLTVKENKLGEDVKEMKIDYSESPVALFLVTPPNNPSYNQLPAFAVDQIFNTIYSTALANGRKSFTRVHFILDEFGNLPPISHMDTKVSIGLGQNLLFDIVVQNLEQLQINYSQQQAETIESNCANLLYILTESKKTAETISAKIGKRTVNVQTSSGKMGDVHGTSISNQLISQDILSMNDLMKLMGGEMVVLRSVYRMDQKGRPVSAMPIFDHGQTEMPFRNTFLQREFNDQMTLSDIGIKSPHRSLDLKALRINYDNAYNQLLELMDDGQEKQADPFGDEAPTASHGEKPHLADEPFMQEFFQENDVFGTNSMLDNAANKQADDQIFTDSELKDEKITNGAFRLIYQAMTQVQPAELRMSFFKDTNAYWSRPDNNSWENLKDRLSGNEQVFEKLKHNLINLKQGGSN